MKKTTMDLNKIEPDIKILQNTALSKINEEGWTLFIICWEDNDYELEYRHGDCKGIHRFFYMPSRNKWHIFYKFQTISEYIDYTNTKVDVAGLIEVCEKIDILQKASII